VFDFYFYLNYSVYLLNLFQYSVHLVFNFDLLMLEQPLFAENVAQAVAIQSELAAVAFVVHMLVA
jgi:hypothetical protein